jgi:hypothetical protein
MVTRDSMVLWLGLAVAVVGYLSSAAKPPMEWSYSEWLQAASFGLAWVMGKLHSSPLPGANDGDRVTPPRVGLWFFPLLLVASLGVSACATVQRTPDVDRIQQTRARALEMAQAVESAGALVVQVGRAATAAEAAGVITRTDRDAVLTAIIALEPKALAVITTAKTVTSEPALRATLGELMRVFDPFVTSLQRSASAELSKLGEALRLAYRVVTVYLGGA